MTIKERITGFAKLDLNYWVFFYVVLAMGNAISFFASLDPRYHPFSFAVAVLIIIYLWNHRPTSESHPKVLYAFGGLFLWYLFHSFTDHQFESGLYYSMGLKLIIGCLLAINYKRLLLDYYSKIVALLSFISIPFWIATIVLGKEFMGSIAPIDQWLKEGHSFLVYTVLDNLSGDSSMYYGLVRNAGFAWEPGRFASCVVLGIVCHTIINGRICWDSWRLRFMVFALITSMSTTGYATFFVFIFLHYVLGSSMNAFRKTSSIILMLVAGSYIMTLPFMTEKMQSNADSSTWVTNRSDIQWIDEQDRAITVDRTEGLFLDYLNLQTAPFLGTGLAFKDTYVYNHISTMMTTSNGLLNPLSRLGLLIGIPYFFLFILGASKITRRWNSSGLYILSIVTLVFQYSYNFMFDIFIMSIIFYALVNDNNKTEIYEDISNRR